jgi:oligosaccharide repeat unit polymerase
MIEVGAFLILISIFYIIIQLEKRLFPSRITPFLCLSLPFIVVTLLAKILSPILKFVSLNIDTVFILTIYLIIFWIGGLFAWKSFSFLKLKKIAHDNIKYEKIYEKRILVWSVLLSLFLIYSANMIMRNYGNIMAVDPDVFAQDFGKGIYGWVRILCVIFMIYIIGTVKLNKKITIIALIITIIPFILYQVKGILLIPLVAGIIYRIVLKKDKITVYRLSQLAIIFIFFFLLTYMVPYIIAGRYDLIFNKYFIFYQLRHIFKNLFSGILAFSEAIRLNLSIPENEKYTVFAPIYNVLRRFIGGERMYNLTQYFVTIDLLNQSSGSNVHTVFGTLYLFIGPIFTGITSFIMGFVGYLFYRLANSLNNFWLTINYSFYCSILFFGWFDYYFRLAFPFICIFLMIVLAIYTELKVKFFKSRYLH